MTLNERPTKIYVPCEHVRLKKTFENNNVFM
jgi:hypothetical protein